MLRSEKEELMTPEERLLWDIFSNQTERSQMTLEVHNGRRKTFPIEYVEVTEKNLAEVATWGGGVVGDEEGVPFVKILDKNAINSRQTKGFVGDFIVHHLELKTFKSFSKKAFSKAFEALDDTNSNITHHEVARDAVTGEFVNEAYAAANPDTTVVESVDIAHVEIKDKPAIEDEGVDPKLLGLTETEIEADKNAALPRDADPS